MSRHKFHPLMSRVCNLIWSRIIKFVQIQEMYSREDETSIGEIHVNRQFYIWARETDHASIPTTGITVFKQSDLLFRPAWKKLQGPDPTALTVFVFWWEVFSLWVRKAVGRPNFFRIQIKTHTYCIFYGQDTSFHFKQILTWLCLETFSKLLVTRKKKTSYFVE